MRTRNVSTIAAAALLFALCLTADPTGQIGATLDPSCKPCDDFFKYVNQKWIDSNPIPGTQGRWGRFNSLREDNLERLRTVLDATVADFNAGKIAKNSPQEKMAHLFISCMDTDTIEKRNLEPIQPALDMVSKISDPASLNKTIVAFYEKGIFAPVVIGSGQDYKNASEVILQVAGGGISLPERDFYFRNDPKSQQTRDKFLDHVAKMHVLLGDSPEQAKATARSILDFETKLASAMMTNVERRNPNNRYNRMDLEGLKKLAPNFTWDQLLQSQSIPLSTPINVTDSKFQQNFSNLLTSESIATWKTYLRWRLLNATADYLPKRFEDQDFEFSKTLSGVTEQRPRWQRCVQRVDGSFGDTLGQEYVKKYFPPKAKARMDELVSNMKLTLADELANAEWLSPETRKQALAKLNKINPKIGYPTKWKDYGPVTTAKGTLVENLQSVRAFERKRNLDKLGKPVDKSEWGMTPPTVNAYYIPLMNEIAFPAGILQPPFFDMNADDAMNYGAIGAVIGHEIGHGFDDQGSKFDADGNLRMWWTPEDRAKFEARAKCIVDQFNSFDVQPGQRHIGQLVTGEALGDLGGLTLAYKAYKRSLNGKKSPVIDGLTGEQRLFIAFARVWGGHSRPEAERTQLQTDPHPVGKSRANETLKNMPEFHEAFGCKRGDTMVRPPEQQCKLW